MSGGKVGQRVSSVKFSFVKRSGQKLAASSFDVVDTTEGDANEAIEKLPATVLKNRKFQEAEKEASAELVIPALSNASFFPSSVAAVGSLATDVLPEPERSKRPVDKYDGETDRVVFHAKIGDEPNYDSVPVEEYGKALLRGMGWREGEPIGVTNKKVTKMVESVPRPKGLGLGAELPSQAKKKHSDKAKDGKEDEQLVLKVGAYVRRRTGAEHRWRHEYGVVLSIDEDNARILVKMAIGKDTVSLSQYTVRVVSASEYKEKARCLNHEKYERIRAS